MSSLVIRTVVLAAAVSGVIVTGCSAKDSAPSSTAESPKVTVNATDTDCVLSASEGAVGPTSFVVTNNGTKVTEFYVYGKDDKVLGEVENISPGLQRQLDITFDDAGSFKVACKPGMVGDGISKSFAVKKGG